MTGPVDVAAMLRARADSYSRDAAAFRAFGDAWSRAQAVICEAVRDELRKCAAEIDNEEVRA